MFKQNRNLVIIALIAIVNALGYGIIIPILYSYSVRYGLSNFQNGLLFATFALCQFISTPIIGRLSDKFGRKPLLIISISGTALSFLIAAFAPSAIFLFIARALDGITAGNIPVAAAVISDTTEPKDRAKGFGILGSSFSFGFIFGPAISAFTVGISPSLPFIIAAVISIIAVLATVFFLPETNQHIGEVKHEGKLFNFDKLIKSLSNSTTGLTLVLTLVYFTSFSMYIYGFQSATVQVFNMSPSLIAIVFTIFGVLGAFAQLLTLGFVTKLFGVKKTFMTSLIWVSISFTVMTFTRTIPQFIIVNILLGLASSFVAPLAQTILSEETDAKEQGEMQGIQASYMSIGQIIGPVLAGIVGTYSPLLPFLGAGICVAICFFLSFQIFGHLAKKVIVP